MERIAIIGTGIAGMACGHLLHGKADVTFYEKNDYIGGHTNTITIESPDETVSLDTGFMVYNEVTYPHLTKLFAALGVETMPTSMSFSVQHKPSGLEFSGSGLNGLFAQRSNLLRPSHYRFLKDIDRFNKESPEVLTNQKFADYTVAQYVSEKGLDPRMLERFLLPMSSAVWSAPTDTMMRFPIQTLVQFFYNHGFLGLNTQHQWRTVRGGSRNYRDKLIAPFRERIHTGRAATSIKRGQGSVCVTSTDRAVEVYDRVIMACHADEALALLAEPTGLEAQLLPPFQYQVNTATVHTDESVMPLTRRAWSSWNYRTVKDNDKGVASSVIYWMNSLQRVSEKRNYFVSIDGADTIQPGTVLRTINYTHPIFSHGAVKNQPLLGELNQDPLINYCGSYFGYGFHEDALASAITLCSKLNAQWKRS